VSGDPSIRINIGPTDGEALLRAVCERTGTTPELWHHLAEVFLAEYHKSPAHRSAMSHVGEWPVTGQGEETR
jgi:hypothetical protein